MEICVICGQAIGVEELTKMPDGEYVCFDCVEDHPEVLETDDTDSSEGGMCAVCGQLRNGEQLTERANGDEVCDPCIERYDIDVDDSVRPDPYCFVCDEIGYPEPRGELTTTCDEKSICLECATEYPEAMDPDKREDVTFETYAEPSPQQTATPTDPTPDQCERCGLPGAVKKSTISGRYFCGPCRSWERKAATSNGVVTDFDPHANERPPYPRYDFF